MSYIKSYRQGNYLTRNWTKSQCQLLTEDNFDELVLGYNVLENFSGTVNGRPGFRNISTGEEKVRLFLSVSWRQTGGRDTALLILNLDTRRRWVVSITPQLLYSWERSLLSVAQDAGWAGLDDLEKTEVPCPCRIRSPAHPACSLIILITVLSLLWKTGTDFQKAPGFQIM